MPLVTSLDGKVYDLDAQTLEKYRLSDAQVAELNNLDPLPPPPVAAPESGTASGWVKVRRGPDNSTFIDVTSPSR